MKILLLGKNGQVGWELQRSLAPLGELIALDRHGANGLSGDLANPDALSMAIEQVQPNVIVNAGAYTAVDKAESEQSQAHQINAVAPTVLAKAAARSGALLVHYSTDYVFDGSGHRPWQENDLTGPLSVYGQTKLAGEQGVTESGCAYLIFRTSWVYAARGGNFAKTMLRLATERESLKVINDQFGAPTGAELIADVTAHAICQTVHQRDLSGIYHLVAGGETNWNAYARFVLDYARAQGRQLKAAVNDVLPIPAVEFPLPAARPANSRMATDKLRSTFGLNLPRWEHGVERMLNEVLTQ